MDSLPPEMIYTILKKTNIQNVMCFCQTNSHYRKLCHNQELWRDLYFRYYHDTGMDQFGMDWFALVKLCFQLDRVVRWLKYYNKIETILSVYRLEELNLCKRQIEKIPKELGQLQALQILDLSHNQIEEIPAQLSQLQTLRELDLSDNQIEEIPAELGQLHTLQKLDLSQNQIKDIPAELGQLKALRQLYLRIKLKKSRRKLDRH